MLRASLLQRESANVPAALIALAFARCLCHCETSCEEPSSPQSGKELLVVLLSVMCGGDNMMSWWWKVSRRVPGPH